MGPNKSASEKMVANAKNIVAAIIIFILFSFFTTQVLPAFSKQLLFNEIILVQSYSTVGPFSFISFLQLKVEEDRSNKI